MIKECIREVLFEEKGTLSHIINEVATGLGTTTKQVVKEAAPPPPKQNNTESLREHKKKLLNAIGADAYRGINIFEGTTPMDNPGGPSAAGALSDVAPNDPGVDISNLFGNKSSAIFNKMMEKK